MQNIFSSLKTPLLILAAVLLLIFAFRLAKRCAGGGMKKNMQGLKRGNNLEKEFRHHQWMMPIVAVVYSAIFVLTYGPLTNLISSLFQLLCSILPFLRALNVDSVTFAVGIVVFLSVFFGIKKLILTIAKKFKSEDPDNFEAIFFKVFYAYDEKDYEQWFLRARMTEVRKAFKVVYYAATLISTALGTCYLFGFEFTKFMFTNSYNPVFLIVILGELFFFIDGLTNEEYED
ncbi:MAG: hypothetical protein MJ189_05215, partial [Coriobacteriales bacterium]|nr:hypothetical protein [Coriobacteriales bacterium]